MNVIISKNEKYISITFQVEGDISLSWEELQDSKDEFFPNLDFIEVYPRKDEIINQANERHLIHIKNWDCVKMGDLEMESDITFKVINK